MEKRIYWFLGLLITGMVAVDFFPSMVALMM